ncbi:MAG: methylated-DNA--[protein]-cysteine S-methyltransferase [Propionibacteriaceae bacterium]|nr:methylated-DNA--[protein]-cysteine S-methyltransferase [Propionibacteriaceae bacterium]
MTIHKAKYQSPLGEIVITADEDAITGLWFTQQRHFPMSVATAAVAETPMLQRAAQWLDAYFAGENPSIDFPLRAQGTRFREAVWEELRQIPYGQTTTYGAIAAKLAAPGQQMSARAVGQAVGHNPISILIPCHRVVGSDDSLTGYGGGLDRKTALLQLEGVQVLPGCD